jgi:hypothetical protein
VAANARKISVREIHENGNISDRAADELFPQQNATDAVRHSALNRKQVHSGDCEASSDEFTVFPFSSSLSFLPLSLFFPRSIHRASVETCNRPRTRDASRSSLLTSFFFLFLK